MRNGWWKDLNLKMKICKCLACFVTQMSYLLSFLTLCLMIVRVFLVVFFTLLLYVIIRHNIKQLYYLFFSDSRNLFVPQPSKLDKFCFICHLKLFKALIDVN
jgi:hypothetical protein